MYELYGFEKIILIDIESSQTHKHHYDNDPAGYCDLQSTKKLFEINGVPAENIITCNPKLQTLPEIPFDVLISTFSMGFHYPFTQYKEFILTHLKPNGLLIFDKRHGEADEDLDEILSQCNSIYTAKNGKYANRVCCQRG